MLSVSLGAGPLPGVPFKCDGGDGFAWLALDPLNTTQAGEGFRGDLFHQVTHVASARLPARCKTCLGAMPGSERLYGVYRCLQCSTSRPFGRLALPISGPPSLTARL